MSCVHSASVSSTTSASLVQCARSRSLHTRLSSPSARRSRIGSASKHASHASRKAGSEHRSPSAMPPPSPRRRPGGGGEGADPRAAAAAPAPYSGRHAGPAAPTALGAQPARARAGCQPRQAVAAPHVLLVQPGAPGRRVRVCARNPRRDPRGGPLGLRTGPRGEAWRCTASRSAPGTPRAAGPLTTSSPFKYQDDDDRRGGPDGTMYDLIREAVDPHTPWRPGQAKLAMNLGDTIRAAAFHDDDAGDWLLSKSDMFLTDVVEEIFDRGASCATTWFPPSTAERAAPSASTARWSTSCPSP